MLNIDWTPLITVISFSTDYIIQCSSSRKHFAIGFLELKTELRLFCPTLRTHYSVRYTDRISDTMTGRIASQLKPMKHLSWNDAIKRVASSLQV